jgi:hypothetical protein
MELPYDGDSEATLYILLDLDEDPLNDDVTVPDPNRIIILEQRTIAEGEFEAIDFNEIIDVAQVPLRNDGRPYFIRATMTNGGNVRPVHAYAKGTISVGLSASGAVNLGAVGKGILGAIFLGFNPGSNLGSRMISARDFDADGFDDFIFVAQFGNPRNFGNIGEAYLIYGLDRVKFGGTINVNSTSTDLPGVIFEAPPVRSAFGFGNLINITNPRTEGLADVAVVSDLTTDGRPELIFGIPHVDGAWQSRDDDPGDDPPEGNETIEVEIAIRLGETRTTIGDNDPIVGSYSGFEDTVIDSAAPDTNFANEDLEWDNDGQGARKWTLIRLRNLLAEIPDTPGNIEGLDASLQFNVVNTGDEATVHEVFTPFEESNVTFANFAVAGGEPQEGEEDDGNTDYDEEELGNVSGAQTGQVDVDITPIIQKLLDNQLAPVNNEVLLILVPGDDADDNTRIRSSEFTTVPDQRPTVNITYQRQLTTGALGCYPDPYPNNFATEEERDVAAFEALGFVAIVNSENRDNNGIINPDRLEATTVSLELVGQDGAEFSIPGAVDEDGASSIEIFALAQAGEPGRIAGARFQAGWYDLLDHMQLRQPPLNADFGRNVDSMPDLNNDQQDEIIISSPLNERDIRDLEEGGFFPFSTHLASRQFFGSIIVMPGTNFDIDFWRDETGEEGASSFPIMDGQFFPGSCSVDDPVDRNLRVQAGTFEIFAEDIDDMLGGGRHAGDFNLDGVPDILAGAPMNDSPAGDETGAAYVIYGRVPVGDFDLSLADNPARRPPMLRVRGRTEGDRLGLRQELLGDVNGDRIPDVVIASPAVDFGNVGRSSCAVDFDGDGDVDNADLSTASFNTCMGREVFVGDACKAFDYDNDRLITEDDGDVLECLQGGGSNDCCPIDNGYVGVIFGGVNIDGDRTIDQVATSDLPGVVFFGASAGHRAGTDVSSAGDFNLDGFSDLLVAVPGETRVDANNVERVGVVYLIFGGPHLTNNVFNLTQVGTDDLPGIVFTSPYSSGRPEEAPPDHVGFLGDINNDGFSDIAIGNTRADFVDTALPQTPGDPGTDPSTGRRPNAGEIYVIYGNNFGSNR